MLAVIAGGSAIAVVVSRNIVRMAVALMFTLVGVAGIFFLLNAEFLAAVQLVVYVGGTLILIVFGVMLTSSSPFAQFSATRAEIAAAITLAVVLLATVILAIPYGGPPGGIAPRAIDGQAPYPMTSLGVSLIGEYLLPFELVSVLLLAVMIGAAYLAKARK
ncbi:NADH-quinone oxidoreductase subunit J [Humisphaera borealis]|uniref:NADH-quinone oxidoreductase subunit J n=2 Tax=Humisphaera borealis TaxID=2807512 RepID=A0A7M2X3U6_9BACT|nr:NADH-quinone oxidoreductase subunit J [Humisphaera borealis]